MKLADEWKHAWKWLSVQLGAVIAIAPELYQQVEGMKEYVPISWFHHAMAAAGILVILNTVKKKAG